MKTLGISFRFLVTKFDFELRTGKNKAKMKGDTQ